MSSAVRSVHKISRQFSPSSRLIGAERFDQVDFVGERLGTNATGPSGERRQARRDEMDIAKTRKRLLKYKRSRMFGG